METLKYDIFAMKSQQMKFNAFFSYLRSFSQAGLQTLQKLESDFQKQMKKNKNEKDTLSIMKNMLTSYEIFILEIKDSCDFVEMPEFGFCIGKTFAEMIKIIKWFLRSWLKNSKKCQEIQNKLENTEHQKTENLESPNVCAFCQQLIKVAPYSKDSKIKRKGVAINDGYEFRAAKKTHMEEKNHLMEFQEHVMEKYTAKEITSKRYISDPGEIDILNKKYATMKLEFSNGGNVLEEVLNEFNMKTEAIARFVNNSKITNLQDFKMSTDITYQNFQKEMKIKIEQKFEQAREKLKILVSNKLQAYERIKKSRMSHVQTQTDFYQISEKEKYEQKIKQLMLSMKKLNNELESEKELNASLKKLLESKSIQFEEQFLKYRKQVIKNFQPKSKSILKSLKSLKQIIQGEDGEKQNSICLPEPPSKERMSTGIRLGGLLKSKDKKKKKNSIRFTLQNESNQEDKDHSPSVPSSNIFDQPFSEQQILVNTIATQTQQVRKDLTRFSSGSQKKFYLIQRETDTIGSQKNDKNILKKPTLLQQSLKKSQINTYSHVKSRVYNRIEANASVVKKDQKISQNHEFNHLVRKLAINNFYSISKSIQSQVVQVHQLASQPTFLVISSVVFTNEDVYNLYLNPKNAHNYQCLLYRNSIFNDNNLNPKRAVHFNHKFNASDLDWNFKRQFETGDTVQSKLTSCLFHQFNNFRKKQKIIYEQIKAIMRSPTEIGNNIEIISFQSPRERQPKEIDFSELKKMISIILKLHGDCIGDQSGSICSHLVKFCTKIGVKII